MYYKFTKIINLMLFVSPSSTIKIFFCNLSITSNIALRTFEPSGIFTSIFVPTFKLKAHGFNAESTLN